MSDIGQDGFLELVEHAQEALCDVIRELEPGTGLDLHVAYTQLKQMAGETRPPEPDPIAERDEREANWTAMSMRGREHALLNALGDDRLTIRELTGRLAATPGWHVWESNVRPMVRRLFDGGDLGRAGERRARGGHHGAIRYRYFRNREVPPSLQHLGGDGA